MTAVFQILPRKLVISLIFAGFTIGVALGAIVGPPEALAAALTSLAGGSAPAKPAAPVRFVAPDLTGAHGFGEQRGGSGSGGGGRGTGGAGGH